jgi:chemotaxis protein MotB
MRTAASAETNADTGSHAPASTAHATTDAAARAAQPAPRRPQRRRALRLAAVALLLPLSACVSLANYRKLELERDALRANKAALAEELRLLKGRTETLEGKIEEREDKISKLQGTYDSLVAQLKDELASGQVQIEQLKEGLRVNLSQEILFPTGSAELDAQGRDVLRRVAFELAKVPHRIEVEGHTDNVPIRGNLAKTYPSNWELAGARAASVVRLFAEGGIDSDRLAAVSFGEEKPVASNASEEGRALNRRIEVRLLPLEGATTLPASLAKGAGAGS